VRPVRRPLPDPLPREVRKYLPKQEACPDCGGKLKHLGEDVSEILEYVPASLKVIQYIRPKLACACCDRIVQAEAPSRPIKRGIAGPGLLAHVLVSKILRSLASLSSVADLCAHRRGVGSLHPGGVGSADPAGCLRRWSKRCDVT
jgi:transposase